MENKYILILRELFHLAPNSKKYVLSKLSYEVYWTT
jgi:hypothetical protein